MVHSIVDTMKLYPQSNCKRYVSTLSIGMPDPQITPDRTMNSIFTLLNHNNPDRVHILNIFNKK